jgi:hypothetical protein
VDVTSGAGGDLQTAFLNALRKRRRRWQSGLLVALLLRTTGVALLVIPALAVADFLFALPALTRVWAGLAAIAALLAMVARKIWEVSRLADKDAARRIDQQETDRRHTVLSGLELIAGGRGERPEAAGILAYLTRTSVQRATAAIGRSPMNRAWPRTQLRRRGRAVAIRTVVVAAVALVGWPITKVVLPRVVLPQRDIPPYTHYRFEVTPDPATVVYGGSVELAVDVTGGQLTEPVLLVTRYGGAAEHRATCFQEGESRYAQRLEGVVSPISYCFRAGRARTTWRHVTILLKPEITAARLFVAPPEYTREMRREVPLSGEDIRAVKGSSVELHLTSNRPLADGALSLRAGEGADPFAEYAGEGIGTHTVAFKWPLEQTSRASVTVRDARGTESEEPFILQLTALPDTPPSVSLNDPPPFALATPRAVLALRGTVEDDFGLRRADVGRGVRGYRDRLLPLAKAGGMRRMDVEERVHLERLGVTPGDVLEFYLEARDSNPDLTGVTASEIARVKIISDEDYAASLRLQTTLEELVGRYRAAAAAMDKAMEELRKLEEMSRQEGADEKALQEQAKRAAEALQAAETLHQALADDVAAFDLEKDLANTLRSTFADLHHSRLRLERSGGGTPAEMGTLAKDLLAKLGQGRTALAKEERRAEMVASVGRVMECVGMYQEIVQRQTNLVRKLTGMAQHQALTDPDLMRSIAHIQSAIREDLLTFVSELGKRAEALPDEFVELRDSARAFAAAVGELQIPDLMHQAAAAAENRDLGGARRHAEIALEKLKLLLDDCGGTGFGGLAQCKLAFKVPKGLSSTLQQVLDAMGKGGLGKLGSGLGTSGWGGASGGGSGYAMNAYSPMNVPLIGSPRHGLATSQRTSGGGGAGKQCPAGAAGRRPPPEEDRIQDTSERQIGADALRRQAVPPKYEEAVRRYFSEDLNE